MSLSAIITEKLLSDNMISEEEFKVIAYGLENLGTNISGLFLTLAIGNLFSHGMDSFLVWLLVFPLRKYAGGFHAETKRKCLFISTGMIIVSYFIFFQIQWKTVSLILVTSISAVIIYFSAPVGNPKKPLDLLEQKIYGTKARKVLLLEGILFSFALYFNWQRLATIIAICFFMVGISLLAGKIKFGGTLR